MKIKDENDIMNYAVNADVLNNGEKPDCLYTVLYFSQTNLTYSLLCKSYITYFSRINGTEEEKKKMAFYNITCYFPKGWNEKIPDTVKFLYKLHDEFTESLTLRIMRTRNKDAYINPEQIHPIEFDELHPVDMSTYTTYDEAEYEYSYAQLNNKKPEV